MENIMEPIHADETFCFSCHPNVPCFNECCRDLNQFLMPYDVLRLKNHLKMKSGDFLDQYVAMNIGPSTGLPVASLIPADKTERVCPFVTPKGCAVYEDRPSSCRMYPLARAVTRSRETGKMTAHYALVKESHCRGFENGKPRSPLDWIAGQGLEQYNQINDLLLEIISLKNMTRQGPLDMAPQRMFHMACYDLDAFRRFMFDDGGADQMEFNSKFTPELLEAARDDDAKLLEAGLLWLKAFLFR